MPYICPLSFEPLHISHYDVCGVIYLDSVKKPYGFLPQDVALFEDIARRALLAIEQHKLPSELASLPH
jgi:GAF domain-containing protein